MCSSQSTALNKALTFSPKNEGSRSLEQPQGSATGQSDRASLGLGTHQDCSPAMTPVAVWVALCGWHCVGGTGWVFLQCSAVFLLCLCAFAPEDGLCQEGRDGL